MALSICFFALAGCQPLAISLLGAGAGTAPMVKQASLIAAKNGGLFYDNATASEIVAQTERLLGSAATGTRGF